MKIFEKIDSLKIENRNFVDLLAKLFLVLSFVYFAFFLAEAILPGVIFDVFNLNLLLVIILSDVFFLLIFTRGKIQIEIGWFLKMILIFCLGLFFAVMLIVLYKISLRESFLYTVFASILLKYLYDYLG